MKLSEFITNYRAKNGLSQRQFAQRCGISHVTISYIEKNLNPHTGNPIVPTLPMLNKIAAGMNLTIDDLLDRVEDFRVSMADNEDLLLTPDQKLLSLYNDLNEEGQEKLLDYADDLVSSGKYIKTGKSSVGAQEA